jgi:Cft2 family RNA processing exonuclease
MVELLRLPLSNKYRNVRGMSLKYTALGGGNEVGASCNLLQLNGTNFLLDAGIRMGAGEAGGPADALPDLALLQEAGGVEAVLVSHAHLDHIGALPLVHQAYPAALIYATVPTVHLMRVLLADALKIMSIKAEQEFECPLYNEELVARMFTRVVPVPVGGSVQLPGAVRAFFFSAGHILGAAMIGLEGAEGRVLYTGDISAGNQRTISGMVAPDFAPHLLIMESTYGNRLHANRQREEKALVETVAEVIESGGHALIPAFALGRAQEIILLIQAHQQAGLIPRFPIWVDGMVRSICQTYINFPELLRGPLKRFINNGGNPFFREKGARPVTSTPLREKVLAGAPACIVSSSGMLTGGPSQFYASRLVDDPRHAIIFCGYQDEESPGHRLLALADNPEATIALDGRETRVQCRLAQYGLSAHADAGELAALAARMRPRRVVLVHGDDDARRALARTLADNRRAVLAPENGEWLEFSFRRAGRGKFAFSPAGGAGGGAPGKKRLHPPDPGELWQELIRNPAAGNKLYSAEELAALWFRGETTPERQAQMAAMLEKDDRYFAADWKHPYFYRPRRPDQVAADRRRETIMQGLSHLPGRLVLVRDGGGAVRAGICYAVDRLGFYAWKVGQDGTWHPADSLLEIIASWYEPAGTAGETQDEEALKSEQKQQLHRFLLRVKPVYRQLKPLKLWEQMRALRAEPATAREWRDMLGLDEGVESLTALAWRLNTHPEYFAREFVPGGVPTYVCREEISRGEAGPDEEMVDRMEQNAALAAAEELFPAGSGLYRKGLDRDAGEITLYFHFPATAVERYRDQIEQLSAVTGWSVRIHPEAHHGALSEAVHRLLPGTWRVLRNPSIHRENSMVSVRCEIPPGEEHMVAEVAGRFKEQTGQELCIERPGETGAGPLQEQPGGSVAGPAEDCMEINAAYAAIRAALQKAGATVYKTGKKRAGSSEYIEVSFISPDVGERYREVLDELQKQTGWPVRINPRPNQNEIKALVRRSLEPAWGLVKEPGFFEIERVVRVKLKAPPAPDDPRWLGLVEEIKVKTGYQVEYIES